MPDADDRAFEAPAANPHARTRASGHFTVVEVAGEIDLASAGFLVEHLDAATAGPEPDVLVDLRRVDFFDCSGLRVLCRAETRARQRGGRLRLVSDRPRIHQLLRASGLLGRFPPLPDVPAEKEAVEKGPVAKEDE
ncbi:MULTISPECIES: STAS domain-containing protein [Streptomyces]|uniref:Anti-sigma factor antagonist n=1 Tax=Streptomyces plumbiresistens TaxID=511811 RepID=A0ABP7QLI9_9ACTN|nr:STAS domain-containing protein [Streptomyces sp. NBC_01373]MCX4705603.1 STAS domain-containing protein [Streptomyces sp. NBC_01373]